MNDTLAFPDLVAALLPDNPGQVIIVTYGESGYRPYGDPLPELAARQMADNLNTRLGVTPAQRDIAIFISMFPNANPVTVTAVFAEHSKPYVVEGIIDIATALARNAQP